MDEEVYLRHHSREAQHGLNVHFKELTKKIRPIDTMHYEAAFLNHIK